MTADADWQVTGDAGGVTLKSGRRTVRFDSTEIARRARQGRRGSLARACGAAPGLAVHDALAGWGTDGLVLARLGCQVHMTETNPRVCEVLAARIEAMPPLPRPPTWACADARASWRTDRFDVVYLDPMFGGSGALPALRMQLLAELAPEPGDAAVTELLDAARRLDVARVVVKRRRRAPEIGSPDWCIRGRAVRFDVYRGGDTAGSR